MAGSPGVVLQDVRRCARCGEDHYKLAFHPLTRPIVIRDDVASYTHWGTCPTNGEPVLYRELPDRK